MIFIVDLLNSVLVPLDASWMFKYLDFLIDKRPSMIANLTLIYTVQWQMQDFMIL